LRSSPITGPFIELLDLRYTANEYLVAAAGPEIVVNQTPNAPPIAGGERIKTKLDDDVAVRRDPSDCGLMSCLGSGGRGVSGARLGQFFSVPPDCNPSRTVSRPLLILFIDKPSKLFTLRIMVSRREESS
jgi:hypothetical protein